MIRCKKCYDKGYGFKLYHEGHDAYYCGICDMWLEPKCSDRNCEYCLGRSEKPSDAVEDKD